jgi:2-C-methyl-D-erythritol 2,4-cyclodiphosphate synthase
LGGLVFEDAPALDGNSDADVILHALTDAISGVTGKTVIGAVADQMCRDGITDSKEYLKVALADLGDWQISHVSIALECLRPKIDPKVPLLRESIAGLLGVTSDDVCLTATTGEGLTDCGRGLGIHASVVLTVLS